MLNEVIENNPPQTKSNAHADTGCAPASYSGLCRHTRRVPVPSQTRRPARPKHTQHSRPRMGLGDSGLGRCWVGSAGRSRPVPDTGSGLWGSGLRSELTCGPGGQMELGLWEADARVPWSLRAMSHGPPGGMGRTGSLGGEAGPAGGGGVTSGPKSPQDPSLPGGWGLWVQSGEGCSGRLPTGVFA